MTASLEVEQPAKLRQVTKKINREITRPDKNNNLIHLSFFLPAGGYATSVLREIVTTK